MNAADESPEEFDDDLSGYLTIYLDETEEQLDDLVETMLILEQQPQNEASLNGAFRLLHSMKGAAGMMGFDQITVLTHHLETRFERLRSGRLELDRVTMNLTLRCLDFLRECNGRLRDGDSLSTPDELLAELRELEDRLEDATERELADELSGGPPPASTAPIDVAAVDSSQHASPPTPWLDAEPSDHGIPRDASAAPPTVLEHLPDLGNDYHLIITFAEDVQLKDLKAQTIATGLGNLGEVKATRPELDELDTNPDLERFDVILNSAESFERMFELIRREAATRIEIRVPRDADAEPLAVWEFRATSIEESEGLGEQQAPEESPGQNAPDQVDASGESSMSMPAKAAAKVIDTMRVDIERLDSLMNLAGELVVNRAQFLQVSEEIGPGLKKSQSQARSRELSESLVRAIALLKQSQEHHGDASGHWANTISDLESGVELLHEQAALWENGRRCFGRLDEAIDQLSRVSDSLQRGVLGTRMVPVGPLFNRFKRVIRDLSQERGKEVDLEIAGEATELDKRMIDALGDPLVHLVRNSIDHGLETPQERVAAGKSPHGRIALSARHRGNHVTIVIRDDGRGIDANRIRQSLVAKGRRTADQAAAMSDDQLIQTIFEPGFSTASQITDISGRGVGMDIVRSRIEELSGSIGIETQSGVGTTFILKMPLTLAIIGSLLIRIGQVIFAIPKDDVREIVSIPIDKLINVHGKRTFEVRGEYCPLVCIQEVFRWSDTVRQTVDSDDDAGRWTEIAVVQSGGRPFGLRVDQCLGSQDVVIKSLDENFIGIAGLAGASILGNGTVALMLDVAELQQMMSRPTRETYRAAP